MNKILTKEEYKNLSEFQKRMKERLEKGREKYGMSYLGEDWNATKELEEELIDGANYLLLLYMRIKKWVKWQKELNQIKEGYNEKK